MLGLNPMNDDNISNKLFLINFEWPHITKTRKYFYPQMTLLKIFVCAFEQTNEHFITFFGRFQKRKKILNIKKQFPNNSGLKINLHETRHCYFVTISTFLDSLPFLQRT